jgi:hypothetical protein
VLCVAGAIRPDLYPRKDIVLQQASLDGAQGRLHIRLKYDFRTSDLVVHLIEGRSRARSRANKNGRLCGDVFCFSSFFLFVLFLFLLTANEIGNAKITLARLVFRHL